MVGQLHCSGSQMRQNMIVGGPGGAAHLMAAKKQREGEKGPAREDES